MEIHFLVNLFGRPWAATCTLGPRVRHSCNGGSASKGGMRDREFHKKTLEIQEMKNKLKVCSSKCACKDHPWKHKTLVQGLPGRRGRPSPSRYTFQSTSDGLLLHQNREYLKTVNPISQRSESRMCFHTH